MHFLYVVVEVWKSVREDTILAENVVSATVWRDLVFFRAGLCGIVVSAV